MRQKILYALSGAFGMFILMLIFLPNEKGANSEMNTAQVPQEIEGEVLEETLGNTDATQTIEERNSFLVTPEERVLYPVTKVIDGDTITLDIQGTNETVRLIGVNTPETVDPRTTVECFGIEASNKAKSLLTGERVSVEMDATQGERDKYGRLLAYVFTEDSLFVNKFMIREGFGYEYTYATPYAYQAEFRAAEALAESEDRGLWAPGVCSDSEVRESSTTSESQIDYVTPTPSNTEFDAGGYTCSANTYNCTDFSSHQDAQHVYEMCGGVVNDIHKLDSDMDGSACESLP